MILFMKNSKKILKLFILKVHIKNHNSVLKLTISLKYFIIFYISYKLSYTIHLEENTSQC